MLSLYAQYVKEREEFETVEIENGFATYKLIDADTVYLRDIFVTTEKRREGLATELSEKIKSIAKDLGAKRLVGSVCTDALGVTVSMKALLVDGFKFSHAVGNMLFFAKDI